MRNKPTLTASDVQKMVAACKSEAAKNKWSVSIAVVDDAGYLLYLERLDGAGPVTAEVATEKAVTAARTRRPTKFWEDRLKERPAFMKFPGVLPLQGGVPVMYQNECVGAIGVSGVQSHEDEQIANAGAAAVA
ncbi:MAG TPA: heme-binding protein [Methylomirabilota bacterium]|jgi:glc operon protein GlcG|nr:heme-binding protein [Methylomirabilota bacterium]